MGGAADYLHENSCALTIDIVVDDELKHKIIEPFKKSLACLEAGNITKDQLIETIVLTEFSEWNELFVYVIDKLMQHNTQGDELL